MLITLKSLLEALKYYEDHEKDKDERGLDIMDPMEYLSIATVLSAEYPMESKKIDLTNRIWKYCICKAIKYQDGIIVLNNSIPLFKNDPSKLADLYRYKHVYFNDKDSIIPAADLYLDNLNNNNNGNSNNNGNDNDNGSESDSSNLKRRNNCIKYLLLSDNFLYAAKLLPDQSDNANGNNDHDTHIMNLARKSSSFEARLLMDLVNGNPLVLKHDAKAESILKLVFFTDLIDTKHLSGLVENVHFDIMIALVLLLLYLDADNYKVWMACAEILNKLELNGLFYKQEMKREGEGREDECMKKDDDQCKSCIITEIFDKNKKSLKSFDLNKESNHIARIIKTHIDFDNNIEYENGKFICIAPKYDRYYSSPYEITPNLLSATRKKKAIKNKSKMNKSSPSPAQNEIKNKSNLNEAKNIKSSRERERIKEEKENINNNNDENVALAIDTNVLISNHEFFKSLLQKDYCYSLVIPSIVNDELIRLCRGHDRVGKRALKTLGFMKKQRLPFLNPSGDVVYDRTEIDYVPFNDEIKNNDDLIIKSCIECQDKGCPIILLSDDIALRSKADKVNLRVISFNEFKVLNSL